MSVPAFPSRFDGRPLRIIARGDCTSRRTLALNPDLFDKKPEFIQNQKSPFVLFNDAAGGKSVTVDYLRSISDLDGMTPMLRDYYLGQASRSILDAEEVDLVLLDSYADMNFELWQTADGLKFWMHPKHLIDTAAFMAAHTKLGRRTLEQSVDDAVQLIGLIRKKNPGVPVLFLNQQTDYYAKLDDRVETYYRLGELVAQKLDGVFYGGVVAKDALQLADVGSCGPGQTLHFQGATYRQMVDKAMADGLAAQLASHVPVQNALQEAAQGEASSAPASDAPLEDPASLPVIDIDFRIDSPTCITACAKTREDTRRAFARYFMFDGEPVEPGVEPVFVPMIIPLEEYSSFDAWEAHIKTFGKGARLRQKRKAEKMGYFVKPFRWHMHIPDIHEANTSMPKRSGGEIRSNLQRTVEEMGGAPTKELPVVMPKCKYHWSMAFGVFQHEPGYKQGDVITNERLVGYITPRRLGDLVSYSQILGHGDHLPNGVLTLLHHEIVRWIFENDKDDGYTDGVKYLMYTGMKPGNKSELLRFKRQAGFRPLRVNAVE